MRRVTKLLPWSALLVVTVLPVVAGLVQRHRDGWYPESDDATIVLLADDVLRGDPPLVGMISTGGSELSDPELHHPGPLELYVIAPFSRALGADLGPTLAAALISAVSIAGLVAGLHSIGGRGLAGIGFVTSALILWGMGGDAPTSIWNPHVVLLPFACFLVHGAAAVAGRRWALLGVVGFGSLVAQTHLSYAGLVGLVVIWVGAVTTWRLVRHRDPLGRPVFASLILGFVLWLPPLIDQVRGDPGNLGQIWRSFTGPGGTTVGFAGLGELSRVAGVPLLGLRPSGDLIQVLPDPSVIDLLPLGFLVLLLLGAAVVASLLRQRPSARSTGGRDGDVVAVAITAVVALAAGCLTAVRIPSSDGIQYQYYGLWMWPLAGVVWTLVGWVLWRLAPAGAVDRARSITSQAWAPVLLGVAVLAGSALPRPGAWGPWAAYRRVAGHLAPAAADAGGGNGGGAILVRFRGATPYLSTGSAVVVSVAAAGGEVLVDPGAPTPVFPWREARRFDDQPVTREIWVVGGDGSDDLPPGAELVARVPILDQVELDRLAGDLAEVSRLVAAGVESGPRRTSDPATLERIEAALDDPAAALEDGELSALVSRGLVTVDGLDADRLFTLDRLRSLAAEEQVSLYLVTAEQRR